MPNKPKIAYFEAAILGKEEVSRLEISMNKASRMQIVQSQKQLIKDILFMDFLQFLLIDEMVKVSLHEFKDQVDVSLRCRGNHLKEFDYVGMLHFL